MKLCRFDGNKLGVVDGGRIRDVTDVVWSRLGTFSYPLPRHDPFIAALPRLKAELERAARDATSVSLDEVALEAPVANPSKLVAAPVNYMDHLQEAEEKLQEYYKAKVKTIHSVGLFLKATTSLIGPAQKVRLRFPERRIDHELELCVIIGRQADRVRANDALDYIAGYSVGLDMTVRGEEERSMRKSIDTFSPLGPWMVTADELGLASDLDISLQVNGETRQKANTRELVLSVPELIEYASRYYTLEPGDVIYTGTPAGVGTVEPGDVIEASIQGVGTLRVEVDA